MAKFYFSIFSFRKFLAGLIFLVLFSHPVLAQNKYWMQRAGGPTPDEAYSISLDDSNNTYTTGYFSGTAGFGPFSLSTFAVSDIFITKTNSLGIYQWAVKAGDGGSDRGQAIKTDVNGNSYITGYYYGTATFGSQHITSVGLQDIFVAKCDRNGNFKWVVSAGGTEADLGNAIALDNNGNVLITGQFTGTATFGTFNLTSTNNNINVFTAKLDSSNGNFLWAKSGTGPHTDRGLGVACDPTGNVYITGQFTDTITFDNVHYSPLYDAIFVVKYDNNGNEQWITTAGGGTYNIANAIAVDNNSNVFITGNFQGTLDFFGNTITRLTNTYFNRIFVAKYDQNANLLWDVADGSSNPLTSNNISLDPSGNPYIIGDFECILNGYADRYGQGTFNTVGYWDIFTAGYAGPNGAWQWSRQIGGHKNNYGYGIAVDPTEHVYTSGSFDEDVIVPMDSNFLGCNSSYDYCPLYLCNYKYCSDDYYGDFGKLSTAGNLDIFIAKPIDLYRQTYDYYLRSGNVCNRPYEGVCINEESNLVCPDTVKDCYKVLLEASSNTCEDIYGNIGPIFNYKWSTNSVQQRINVNTKGWYSVTQTSEDGCFVSTDSVYALIYPTPQKPWISDNVIVETDDTNYYQIILCGRDCILTGGNFGTNKYYWDTPLNNGVDSVSVTATSSGDYCFWVTNSFGCQNFTCVNVIIQDTFPKIVPELTCQNDPLDHDTVFICQGGSFIMIPYDTLTNPKGYPNYCIPPYKDITIYWGATPSNISYATRTYCRNFGSDYNTFFPSDSGWYYITAEIIRKNLCEQDTFIVHDSVYVRFEPVPNPPTISISGKTKVCPGEMTWLKVTCDTTFTWWNSTSPDSIYVGRGNYSATTTTITTKFGCTASATAEVDVTQYAPPHPYIGMLPSDGLICPNDSVELECVTSSKDGTLQWYGPYGPFGSDTGRIVYVKIPGYYYCYVSDTIPCPANALTNSELVELYATPYLVVTPSYTICPGDSAKLSVITSNGAIISWLAPLSGSDTVQYVTASGTYSCKVISCGITTIVSATILSASPDPKINVAPSTTICLNGSDTVFLSGDGGMAQYVWSPGNIINPKDTVTVPGIYTLTVTDNYGCTASSSITISPTSPVVDSSLTHFDIPCSGENTGSINIAISGGKPSYSYAWSNGATTSAISGLSAGTYTISASDKCGSSVTASVIITQPNLLSDSSNTILNVNCYGNSTGSINLNVTGGTPFYSYHWSNSATTSMISGLSAGTYTVAITDKNGCATTTSITLTQPTALATSGISNTDETCNGGNNASASVTASGGSPSYTYLWNPGGQTTPAVSNLSAGSYSVIVTDSAGCSLTSTVSITQPNATAPVVTPIEATCINNDGSISVSVTGGTSPYTYLWNPGSNTNSSVSGLSSGNYTVTITDANGCKDTISGNVGINKTFSVTITCQDSICKGQNVTLIASGATTYIWSNSSTSSSITISPTGTATYWVIGSTGVCNDSIPYTVYTYKSISSNMPATDTICPGKPIVLKVNVAGGKPAYTYAWSNGIANDNPGPITVYPTSTTTYSVTVTDACNYITTDTTRVYVVPSGMVSFIVTPDTLQPGQTLNFTNTSQNITNYLWSFGDGNSSTLGTPTHVYSVAGTYQIILIGENSHGCPDTAVQDVYVTPTINIPNIFTPNGDGINDIFYFNIEGATCLHCHIYNRWGVLVYILNSVAEGWPGIIRQTNEQASDGVYYYILEYCDFKGISHNLDGFIQLMRNKQ